MCLQGGLGTAPLPAAQAGHQAGETFMSSQQRMSSSGLAAPAVDKPLASLEGSRAGRGGAELQAVLGAGDQGGVGAGEASAAGQAFLVQHSQVVFAEVEEKLYLLLKRQGLVSPLGQEADRFHEGWEAHSWGGGRGEGSQEEP